MRMQSRICLDKCKLIAVNCILDYHLNSIRENLGNLVAPEVLNSVGTSFFRYKDDEVGT